MKFDQVSSDDHQMSLAGGVPRSPVMATRSHQQGCPQVSCLGQVHMSQCIMGNGHMGTPSPYEQIDACENHTFLQLRLWAVIKWCLILLSIICKHNEYKYEILYCIALIYTLFYDVLTRSSPQIQIFFSGYHAKGSGILIMKRFMLKRSR